MTILCHVFKKPVRVGDTLTNAHGQEFTVSGISATGKLMSDDPLLEGGFSPWSCSWPEADDRKKLRDMTRKVTDLHVRAITAEKQRDELLDSVERCYRMLLSEPDTKGALFKAENILRESIASAKGGAK